MGLHFLLSQTREERDMLSEDLASHLLKREELVLTAEELAIHIEGLETESHKFTAEGQSDIQKYYIELVQRTFETFANSLQSEKAVKTAEECAVAAMKILEEKELSELELEKCFEDLCTALRLVPDKAKLVKHKQNYLKLWENTCQSCRNDLEISRAWLQKTEEKMKNVTNFVENTLRPAIHAVFIHFLLSRST